MNRGNFFRRVVSMLFVAAIMLFAAVSHAEICIGKGSYTVCELEDLKVAKERAKVAAMLDACKKAGVYVKSCSLTKNFKLEEDVIETMTANIVKFVGEPQFNIENSLIRVTVKVQIDDEDISRWLKKDHDEKYFLVDRIKSIRKDYEEQSEQSAELKRQLANNPKDREKIAKKFAEADKNFLLNQKIDAAWKLYANGDSNGAISTLDKEIKLNPNSYRLYNNRGLIYGSLDKRESALKDFDKAIELNPNYAEAYNNRGLCYAKKENYEQALKNFNKAIELNPNYAEACNNRGLCHMAQENYKQAIQDFNKTVGIDPNNFYAYSLLGTCYDTLKNYDLAIQNYTKAIKFASNSNRSSLLYNFRGSCYVQQEKFDLAIQDFNKAIEMKPGFPFSYELRGKCYAAMGENEKAIQDFNKAIEFVPNYNEAYYYRGLCYQKLGQNKKAEADFAKAKELGYKG